MGAASGTAVRVVRVRKQTWQSAPLTWGYRMRCQDPRDDQESSEKHEMAQSREKRGNTHA